MIESAGVDTTRKKLRQERHHNRDAGADPNKAQRMFDIDFYNYAVPLTLKLWEFENRICSSLNITFHECKLLMGKGMSDCRWRVQFAGSVAA